MRFKNSTKSQALKPQDTHKRLEGLKFMDFFLAFLVVSATAVVIAIIVTYVIATQQTLSSYITPIPLTQKEYARGEVISGYFEGRKIYNGKVKIVRQLSCSDGYIETLSDLKTGEKYTSSLLPAREINGELPRNIAEVPANATPGASCIVAFDHQACIAYLFGCYEQHYAYVSLPFIVAGKSTGAPTKAETQTVPPHDTKVPSEGEGLSPPIVNRDTSQNSSIAPKQGTVPIIVDPETPSGDGGSNLQEVLEGINGVAEDIIRPVDQTLDTILGKKKDV